MLANSFAVDADMALKTIFLSHIHEEAEVAKIFKETIEREFKGFVNVFVSTDGLSIPAGMNFLQYIASGLIECSAALYLLSEKSVKRPWINFELGAVWLRSEILNRKNEGQLPCIPICYAGMRPGALPSPIGNLNAIVGTDAADLRQAFASLLSSLGGAGDLSTDFNSLAAQIKLQEDKMLIGKNLAFVFSMAPTNAKHDLIRHCEQNSSLSTINVEMGFQRQEFIEAVRALRNGVLQGQIELQTGDPAMVPTINGMVSGTELKIFVSPVLILRHQDSLV